MADSVDAPRVSAPDEGAVAASFPVVGIGASAGGLAPVAQILSHLGEPNLALVIVPHLDPTHESHLVEIFARSTPMPVLAVHDGMRVEPRHVYVIPPNAEMVIRRGVLHLTPRSDDGQRTPIDRFFLSLAEDRGASAVGIVVSGTLSDGSRGIQAIKGEGGLTFAQDETALHGGMPKSAIATGSVDFVLPPDRIAEELTRIAAAPPSDPAARPSAADEAELLRILAAVRHATGLDFAHYKPMTLLRRMSRRAFLRRLGSLREYADLVELDATEAAALSEEVLIHVTSFFREPEAFEALKLAVFPRLLADRRVDAPIRIWVPGCSTGEEVYSLAIVLREFQGEHRARDISFRIFGTDVSRVALARARAAVYPENIAREVSSGRLRRYFVRTAAGYQIAKEVRDRCVFAVQDVKRDPPFAKIDLISCRNVMIYLAPLLQRRILQIFHYALTDAGFLFLGGSESVGSFAGFAVVDAKNKVYARLPLKSPAPFELGGGRAWEAVVYPAAAARPEKRAKIEDVRRDAGHAIVNALAPVALLVADDMTVVDFRGETGPYVQPAPGAASLDLLRLAHEELRIPLGQAIEEARKTKKPARSDTVALGVGEARIECALEVVPFTAPPGGALFFAVLFRRAPAPRSATPGREHPPSERARPSVEDDLRRELASAREYLQSVIEQLEAGNEELRAANDETIASNEELQSTNEELQTVSEELQATNEELRSVNEEMVDRNTESTHLAEDLTNVLASVSIPIVLLGRDSRIRRFTPAAARILRLIPTDVGRPIGDIKPRMQAPELTAMIDDVLQRLAPVERVVLGDDGRWYQLGVRPYMTLDNRIDGTIVTALDIDAIKKGELTLAEARDYAEAIVDTVRERLLVLDAELRVRSANRSFYVAFDTSPRETEGHLLSELGGGDWDGPELGERLAALGAEGQFEGLRLERDFRRIGRRVLIASGRRMARTPWIHLALDDITDPASAADALERSEASFRGVLANAADAILTSDPAGRIAFANDAALRMFGYAADEIVGLPIDTLVPERLREAHVRHRAGYRAAPIARAMGRGLDLVARRRDGSELPVEVMLSTMDGVDGLRVVAFVTDVTARKEAERRIHDYQTKLQRAAFEAAVGEQQERRRIAIDLHDHLGQGLAVAQMKMTSARDLTQGEPREAIEQAIDIVAQSIAETRSLTFELSPPILYDLGLRPALAWLAEEIEKRYGLHVEVLGEDTKTPLDEVKSALLFRAVRELLMNVRKHADVLTARVWLKDTDDHVVIDVEDAGVGFETAACASPTAGFGLFSVREQIARLGGALEIVSAPRQGTRVTLRVPLDPAKASSSSSVDRAARSADAPSRPPEPS